MDGTDSSGSNEGDAIILNGTDGSSTNADDNVIQDGPGSAGAFTDVTAATYDDLTGGTDDYSVTAGEKKIAYDLFADTENFDDEVATKWTVSIFYINTNNGYTKFEDGTIVKSFANRLLTFPSNLKHCGTSCTDERTRVVINFNYFK